MYSTANALSQLRELEAYSTDAVRSKHIIVNEPKPVFELHTV